MAIEKQSISNTFELEEHKLSEIIKSGGKTSQNEPSHLEQESPADPVKQDFQKKQLSRQNLHSNLYPTQNSSAKNVWSTQKDHLRQIPHFFESHQDTQTKLSGTLGNSQNENSLSTNLAQHLKRKRSRQSGKGAFNSGLKSQSKGKLFSMRKQVKMSQQKAEQNSRRLESKLLSASEMKTKLVQKNTKLMIDRAKLSKEDFSFPGRKLASLFEMRKQKSSKKSLLEKKIILQARLDRKEHSTNLIRCERQNSIFEETQAKFEQNSSSTRAALLLQKIVTKDKSPLSRLGAQLKTGPNGGNKKSRVQVKRTRTREFGKDPENGSQTKYLAHRRHAPRNESLDLSESMRGGQSKTNSRRKDRFFYKKSLKTHDYNREVGLTRAKKTRRSSPSTCSRRNRPLRRRKSTLISRVPGI